MMILEKLRQKLESKRFGFRIQETMSGSHDFETGCGPTGHHPLEFSGTWGTSDVSKWLNPKCDDFLISDFSGLITVGGLCKATPFQGRLEMRYLSEKKLRYVLEFTHREKDYQYIGEKVNIRWWNLPVSHTTCFGVLKEKKSGKLISRSVTYFRLLDTPKFLASLRFSTSPTS